MNPYLSNALSEYEKTEDFLKKDLSSLRVGRANAGMVENIMVDAYGIKTPLHHLGTIAAPDPRTLVIQPWDKNITKDIEKAILAAHIGLAPVNEGGIVRLSLPQLTEEDRKNLVKLLNQKIEQAKIKLRLIRDRVREEILNAEKRKEITEDDKYDFLRELDEYNKKNNEKYDDIGEKKKNDIMTI